MCDIQIVMWNVKQNQNNKTITNKWLKIGEVVAIFLLRLLDIYTKTHTHTYWLCIDWIDRIGKYTTYIQFISHSKQSFEFVAVLAKLRCLSQCSTFQFVLHINWYFQVFFYHLPNNTLLFSREKKIKEDDDYRALLLSKSNLSSHSMWFHIGLTESKRNTF